MALRASILTPPACGLRAPLAGHCVLDLGKLSNHRQEAVALMAYPPPRLACKGLSRHILGRKLPAVFHVPLHAAWLWIVRAHRDLPTAAEQIRQVGGDSTPQEH
ncbi:hypothetical protein ACPTKS_30785 [Pseudomonas aeruginosa]|uniref:hypothetical protein n=1 Tax=Pseudomonas aeruginosa TaxID=287 RepID=UPI003CC5FD3B